MFPSGSLAILGYAVVFGMVGVESLGVPLPGETTLVAAAILASQGKLHIVGVLAAAVLGAVVGDSIGYWIGHRGGLPLLSRISARYPHHASPERVARAQDLFARHGPWAVFFGRWVAVLRIFAGPLAGISKMPYPKFLAANVAGALSWVCTIGLVTYAIGTRARAIFERIGLGLAIGVAAAVAAAVVVGWLVHRRRDRRAAACPATEPVESPAPRS